MNFLTRVSNFSFSTLIKLPSNSSTLIRNISITSSRYCQEQTEEEKPKEAAAKIDPAIDRTQFIPVETSIKYLKSSAYKTTYGEQPVWVPYRRNYKGLYPPRKTRKTCIRKGLISTGNPCPICRDEYLVLHEDNRELLKQFISPQTGEIIGYNKTGLCQKKHFDLNIAVARAKDKGTLTYDVPFRDYEDYYKEAEKKYGKQ